MSKPFRTPRAEPKSRPVHTAKEPPAASYSAIASKVPVASGSGLSPSHDNTENHGDLGILHVLKICWKHMQIMVPDFVPEKYRKHLDMSPPQETQRWSSVFHLVFCNRVRAAGTWSGFNKVPSRSDASSFTDANKASLVIMAPQIKRFRFNNFGTCCKMLHVEWILNF